MRKIRREAPAGHPGRCQLTPVSVLPAAAVRAAGDQANLPTVLLSTFFLTSPLIIHKLELTFNSPLKVGRGKLKF